MATDDHISSSTTSLLGRIVRAVNWQKEAKQYEDTVSELQYLGEENPAIEATSESFHYSNDLVSDFRGGQLVFCNVKVLLQTGVPFPRLAMNEKSNELRSLGGSLREVLRDNG